ncbi:hypothetical protein V2I01_43290 [Micromonospora sp. BRA006-A]|nr:hypothetical protein [Micromonospora sp. BRA006-A]
MAVFTDPMRMREAVPAARTAVRDFLAEAVPAVGALRGPVGYAPIPLEDVDWTAFDIIASDAGYRDATNSAVFPQSLAAAVGQGKPYAATEFGCCTHRGAADVAGATEPVVYDEHGRAAKLTAELERDEEGQARYLVDLLRDYEAGGAEAAFVYTFANRHLPTTGDPGTTTTWRHAGSCACWTARGRPGRLPRPGRYGRLRALSRPNSVVVIAADGQGRTAHRRRAPPPRPGPGETMRAATTLPGPLPVLPWAPPWPC